MRRQCPRLPIGADLDWCPRSEKEYHRGWGQCQFHGGPWRGLSGIVFLPTPLIGSLPELAESPDLRPPGLAETHLCFSQHPSSGSTIPTYTQARSPPHPRFQNSLFADIYSALPQPGSLPRPGQCSEKSGSPPHKEPGVLFPLPSAWSPRAASPSPRTRPAPGPRLGLRRRSPGSGGWGRRARRPPTPSPSPRRRFGGGEGGCTAHKAPLEPHASGTPPAQAGGGDRRDEALPSGAGESSAEQPGWGRGRRRGVAAPASRPPSRPPSPPPPGPVLPPPPLGSRSGRGPWEQ